MNKIKAFFKLEENGTTVSKEFIAGLTTFFAMVYIIFVNPTILGAAGMNTSAVFLATILATIIGTLVMGLFANVPYAVAPGMGLNAFFTYTVVLGMGFNWKEGLALVFICGIINIVITVTNIRKAIIKAIPESLQNAIGGGIGLFIAYIGILNVSGINFGSVPEMSNFNNIPFLVTIIGVILTVILLVCKVPGAILIGILATTIIGIPFGVTSISELKFDIAAPFKALPETFLEAFKGFGTLFTENGDFSITRTLLAFLAIFAFSLTDTFDTIGTFIGTGRKTGIFTDKDIELVSTGGSGMNSKMEKALFADSIATSIGALLGTSNTTTYVESSAGIEAGGKTGLTSVFVAILFALCILISPLIGIVPSAATSPALIVVGIMMTSSFKSIEWNDFSVATPAFFTVLMMTLAYNISIGIGLGFILYVVIKAVKGEAKDVHPILWVCTGIFVTYFVLMALHAAEIF